MRWQAERMDKSFPHSSPLPSSIPLLCTMFLNRLKFQRKLMIIFVGMALLPTLVVVLVAYHLISGSIERWADSQIALTLTHSAKTARDAETLAYQLSVHDYFQLTEAAEILAVDLDLVEGLETGDTSVLKNRATVLADAYSEYLIAIYDQSEHRVFSTDEALPPVQLTDFLPPLAELTDEATISLELENQGLLICGMLVFAEEDAAERVGIVVVGKSMAITPSQMREERTGIQGKLDTLETNIDETGTKYRRTERRNTFIALLITAVVVVILSFWVSRILAQDINTPIETLVASTKQIADGNLKHKVDVKTDDEFAILADAFNRMVSELDARTEELKRAEKTAAWQDIAQKLAHEIKNPLTPIQLSAQRLHRRYHKNADDFEDLLERCTQTITTEVDGLRRLLDEFSQLARLPAPDLAPIDLREIVEGTLVLFGEFPPHIQCQTDIPSDLPLVIGDADYLKRAFLNLIQNALEAMTETPDGVLTIRGFQTTDPAKVFLAFSDTGCGIPAEVRPKLFTPHVSTKQEGTGLGLAIVKKIMTDLGGDIRVEDTKPDQIGTTFTLWLKLASEVHPGRHNPPQ